MWAATFFEGGRLAYWKCEECDVVDRKAEDLPERLQVASGWIRSPPRMLARGSGAPTSSRRWSTTAGTTLLEGDPSSIDFVGVPIPDLTEVHAYTERNERGDTVATYEPSRERDSPYGNRYTLTRYQVVGNELVRFVTFCFEESTYDTSANRSGAWSFRG